MAFYPLKKTTRRKKKDPPAQPQTTFLGLNINSLIQSVVGSVVIFLITTSIEQGRTNHDLLISHTEKIKSIQTEQARIRKEYSPPVVKQ